MRLIIFLLILLGSTKSVLAQTPIAPAPQKKFYFRGFFEREEVAQRQAEYVELVKTDSDSLKTIEIRHIALDQIVLEAFFQNKQPTGTWYYHLNSGAKILNYEFELKYGTAAPDSADKPFYLPDSIKLPNAMIDDDRQQYKAPQLATGQASFNEFLQENLVYPYPAMVQQTMGKVLVGMLIDEDGLVSNIHVEDSVNPILDKEAMRIMRKLRFRSGAQYKGKPIRLYYRLTISFYFS